MVSRLVAVLLIGSATSLSAEPVALTFDDLPVFGQVASTADAAAITEKLLAGLVRHHMPATGFVNEIKLEGFDKARRIGLLTRWLDAGMDLGNHSYSHLSLSTTPIEAYVADVARGETVTRALLAAHGRAPRWYRHPYLETGRTAEIRTRFETWLGDHGYRVAPVSMENDDFLFALPYDDDVVRGDRKAARAVQLSYLNYTTRMVAWYKQAALGLLGRRPAFIFLLHASRLNADSIGALDRILRRQHLRPASLDRAIADPAYAIPDTYYGLDGDSWLTRWALTLHKDLPWGSLPHPPDDIVNASARLDAAMRVPPPR